MSFYDTVRKAVLPFLGDVLKETNDVVDHGLYVSYDLGMNEYACTLKMSEPQAEQFFKRRLGFKENPMAAWKRVRGTNKGEIASLRYTNADEEFYGLRPPAGALQYEQDGVADFQLHVILFELDGDSDTVAVFCHFELAWDTHPVGHYRGKYYKPAFGAEMLSAMLQEEFGEAYADMVYYDTHTVEGLKKSA